MKGSRACEKEAIGTLVADGQPVVRHGLRHGFEATGRIRVLAEADDGESAWRAYRKVRPDVVVLDIQLPGVSGLETIRRIRRYDPDARILVFSEHENAGFVKRARKAGANGYFTKDRALEAVIEGVLRLGSAEGRETAWVASEDPGRRRAGQRLDLLTQREFEVFGLLARGHSTAEVAARLNISINTVGVHKTRIMHKLGVSNGSQLTLFAIRHGVIKA